MYTLSVLEGPLGGECAAQNPLSCALKSQPHARPTSFMAHQCPDGDLNFKLKGGPDPGWAGIMMGPTCQTRMCGLQLEVFFVWCTGVVSCTTVPVSPSRTHCAHACPVLL